MNSHALVARFYFESTVCIRETTMNRRDFGALALGAGLNPLLTPPALAQSNAVRPMATESQPINVVVKNSPRTYNQLNAPRKYIKGKRRFSIYWSWNYPWESNQDLASLNN